MNKSIWQSRTFWATVVDVVVSLIVYFVTKYAAPEVTKDVLFVIGLLQPVIIAYILGKNYQDAHIIPTQINSTFDAEMSRDARAFALSPEAKRYFAEQDAQHDQGSETASVGDNVTEYAFPKVICGNDSQGAG